MGVVHKLKPEIINFIIKSKTDTPSLSCRSLSALVQDAFKVDVSKSAINKIIKDVNLSSPIGRRKGLRSHPSLKLNKKFKFPEKKKKIFFQDRSTLAILSDMKHQLETQEFVDGAGSVFLKAAEWEVSSEPILESMFKECFQEEKNEKIRSISEVLSLLKAFKIKTMNELENYSGKGLWALCDQGGDIKENDVAGVLNRIKDRKEFFLRLSLKVPQVFTLVEAFKITLTDGSVFFIDGQTVSIWKKPPKGLSISLGKATDVLAKMLNNVHSVVVNSLSPKKSGKSMESTQINDFLNSFENVQSKRFHKIELIGDDGCVLGCFDEIPQMKRFFIAGLWPWEKMFQRFLETKTIFCEGKLSVEIFGKDISFKDVGIKLDFDNKARFFRGILLYGPFMLAPFLVLITNLDKEGFSAEQCILKYYQRWPNLEKGTRFSIISDVTQWKAMLKTHKKSFLDFVLNKTPSGQDPVWMAIDQLLFLSDRFVRRHFFPEDYELVDFSTMQNRFYSLPGKIVSNDQRYIVELRAPESSPYLQDLMFAVQCLNESGVKNFDKKNVSIILV